jgi:hypothetical protein
MEAWPAWAWTAGPAHCADAPDTKTPDTYGVCSIGLTQSPQYTDARKS